MSWSGLRWVVVVFFFQAEDGIRGRLVTGVQSVIFRSPKTTFACGKLNINVAAQLDENWVFITMEQFQKFMHFHDTLSGKTMFVHDKYMFEIGRASCRESV